LIKDAFKRNGYGNRTTTISNRPEFGYVHQLVAFQLVDPAVGDEVEVISRMAPVVGR